MSDLQQVIRERDDITGKVRRPQSGLDRPSGSQTCGLESNEVGRQSHKTPKWIKRANKDIKIWEKLMKRRYPIKWRLLKLIRYQIF